MLRPATLLPAVALALTLFAQSADAQDWKQTLSDQVRTGLRGPVDSSNLTAPILVAPRVAGLSVRRDQAFPIIITTFENGELKSPGLFSPHRFDSQQDRRIRIGEPVELGDVVVTDNQVKVFFEGTFDMAQAPEAGRVEYVQQHFRGAVAFTYDRERLARSTWDSLSTSILAVIGPGQIPRITLGLTRAQVEAMLGKPDSIVDLGTKVLYVYKALKIQFMDGKVADVQ